MGDLDQHAGSIARLGVASAGATMGEVDQDFDALHDDVVRFFAGDVGYKANATGIVFVTGIVESLRFRQPCERYIRRS